MQVIRGHFIRYALVGICLNATFYAAYLLLAWLLRGTEAAMTITFCVGTYVSFVAHRDVTFRHRGDRHAALRRFLVCYGILYVIDFAALWIFVRRLDVPHQIVQGGAVVVLALLGFAMQKYIVFPVATVPTGAVPARIRE